MYSDTLRIRKKIPKALPLSISLLAITLLLTGCETSQKKPEAEPAKVVVEPFVPAPHLENVSVKDIRFAQFALKQLDYDIGDVDGIWGQRSEKALKQFEQDQGIRSAGGKLSLANLSALNKLAKVKTSDIEPAQPKSAEQVGISSKLSKEPSVEDDPELILLDKPYPMMEKPNPFSLMVAVLQAGVGVYVISSDNGWYEIESLDEQRGYIKEP